MRIDCSAEGAVSIRDDLRHCYVLIFLFSARAFFLGWNFFLFFLVVYLDLI